MRWLQRPPPSTKYSQKSFCDSAQLSALRWQSNYFCSILNFSQLSFNKCKRNIPANFISRIIIICLLIIPHYGSCNVMNANNVAATVGNDTAALDIATTAAAAQDESTTATTTALGAKTITAPHTTFAATATSVAKETAVWRITPAKPFEEKPPPIPESKFHDLRQNVFLSEINSTNEPQVQAIIDEISIANSEIFRETGYGHKKRSSHRLPQRRQQYTPNDESFTNTEVSTPPPLNLAEISFVSPTDEILFHANESLVHVRTENWLLPFNACMEARFRLEGKRTRLLIYTCQMTEGGECALDKFTALDALDAMNIANHNGNSDTGEFGSLQAERCIRLRPWMYFKTPFAFHFKFVRRPRRFADPAIEQRFSRRRRLGRRATREVGRVTLKGFKDCEKSCVRDVNNGRWNDNGSIQESHFSVVKYEPSKRRKRRRLHPKALH